MTSENCLFRVFSKGTRSEGEEIRRSANWAAARRAWLRVFPDRLEMGDWVIPHRAIEKATLFRLKTLLGGYVLRLVTAGHTYQFGINPWALRGRTFPFPHEREETRLGHTAVSIVARIALVVSLLLWLLATLWE